MGTEEEKGRRETRIFSEFIECLGLPIDSIEKRKPPEPDLLCRVRGEGLVAFEVYELCDEDMAEPMGLLAKAEKGGVHLISPSGTSRENLRKKLTRTYQTNHPIELLCYSDGRIIDPSDMILPVVRPLVDSQRGGPFRHVWLFETKRVYPVWPFVLSAGQDEGKVVGGMFSSLLRSSWTDSF